MGDSVYSHSSVKLNKFKEICQDLDKDKNGYINTSTFMNLLKEIKDLRQLDDTDLEWIKRNSHLQGKLNYKQIFKKLNFITDQTTRQTKSQNRTSRIGHSRNNNRLDNEQTAVRYTDATFDNFMTPMERKQKLMASDYKLYQHPNDSQIEHFYRKNAIEFPKYEYMNGSFQTSQQIFSTIDRKNDRISKAPYMSLDVQTQISKHSDIREPLLNLVYAQFRDKIPRYDVRRLYNLRKVLIQMQKDDQLKVLISEQVISHLRKILKEDTAYELVLKYINDPEHYLNIHKLDLLIKRFEDGTDYYRSYSRDQKYIGHIKNQNQLEGDLKKQLLYLHTLFDLKFKTFHHAFQFFDLQKKGHFTQNEWLRGLRELGQDCLLDSEAIKIFEYLDSKYGDGKIYVEQFKDVLYYQRQLQDNGLISTGRVGTSMRTTRNLNQLATGRQNKTYDSLSRVCDVFADTSNYVSTKQQWFKQKDDIQKIAYQNNGITYGKKALRSESIDDIINQVPCQEFEKNITDKKQQYQKIQDVSRKTMYGYKSFKINRAFQLKSQKIHDDIASNSNVYHNRAPSASGVKRLQIKNNNNKL